jgi:hypothetical protein
MSIFGNLVVPDTCSVDSSATLLCVAADTANPVPAPLPKKVSKPRSWRKYFESPNSHANIVDKITDASYGNGLLIHQLQHPSRPTKRNPTSWSPLEDQRLIESVYRNGTRNWADVASTIQILSAGLSDRTGKQCRERWHNHLDPTLSHAPFSVVEDQLLIRLQRIFDNKWTEISKRMPGRSDNAVKNRWNSCLFKLVNTLDKDDDVGKKRLPESETNYDETFAISSRSPLKDLKEHANIQQSTASSMSALPCAVRSVRRSPPDAAVKAAVSQHLITDDSVYCFAEPCSQLAQFGYRSSSGQVRRTRCMMHREAGMYVKQYFH